MATNPYSGRSSSPTGDVNGSTGLTKKQEEMGQTRNPYGVTMNAPKAPSTGVEQQTQSPFEQKQKMEGQNKQYQQNKATTESNQQMNELNAKLGQGALEVQAAVNKFLSAPTQGADIRGTNTASFDAASKQWGVTTALDDTKKLDPIIAEKTAQQAGVTGSAAFKDIWGVDPVTGDMTPVSYQDYIKKQVASGTIGGFNEVGKDAKVNHMMQLVAQLNALDQAGMADSPQYTALQNMITREDDQGLVAGLVRAKQKFNRLTGKDDYGKRLTYSGDAGGKEYTVGDIGGLKAGTIKSEVEKGVLDPASTGLFSGDWGATTRREADTESAEYKAAAEHEKQLNQEVYTAGKSWANKWASDLQAKANVIMPKLKAIAPTIKAELEKQGAIGAEGLAWFEAASSGDLVTVMTNAVLDPTSGLLPEQRKILGKYLGDLLGDPNYVEKGQLATWMDQLNTKGFFMAEDGRTEVKPTPAQKMDILNILYNPGLSDADKMTRVQNKFKEVASTQQNSLENAMESVNRGLVGFDDAVKTVTDSTTKSIASYSGSALEELAREHYGVTDKEWESLDAGARAARIQGLIKANPNIIKEIQASEAEHLKTKVKEQAQRQASIYLQDVESIKSQYGAAITASQQMADQLRNIQIDPNADRNIAEYGAQKDALLAKGNLTPTERAQVTNLEIAIANASAPARQKAAIQAAMASISAEASRANAKMGELQKKADEIVKASNEFSIQMAKPQTIIKASLLMAKNLGLDSLASDIGYRKGYDAQQGYISLNRAGDLPNVDPTSVEGAGTYDYGANMNAAAAKGIEDSSKIQIQNPVAIPGVPAAPAVATPAPAPLADRFQGRERTEVNKGPAEKLAPKETVPNQYGPDYPAMDPSATEQEHLEAAVKAQVDKNRETNASAESAITNQNKERIIDQYGGSAGPKDTPASAAGKSIWDKLSDQQKQQARNEAARKVEEARSIWERLGSLAGVTKPPEVTENDIYSAAVDVVADNMTNNQMAQDTPAADPDEEARLIQQAIEGAADTRLPPVTPTSQAEKDDIKSKADAKADQEKADQDKFDKENQDQANKDADNEAGTGKKK